MNPKVLVVCGYGRSGSTLLDRVLGRIEGFFSAGEVRHIWREGLKENRLCGCGTPFRDCSVWNTILARAFGNDLCPEEILHLQSGVDRWVRIPQIAAARPSSFEIRLEEYLDVLGRLYRATAEVTGADVIVDSSKDVSHGWLLTKLRSVDVHVLQLVRDSRATAYSWQRSKFNPGSGREMQRYGWVRNAMQWNAINGLTALLERTDIPFSRLRYEDFVADPQQAAQRVLEFLREEERRPPIDSRGAIYLGVDHTVAGNPLRFKRGIVHIRPDDEWRRAMGPAAKSVVGALTWPLLLRYGFAGPRNRS